MKNNIYPFNYNGVYAYKLIPEKDLINYEKPSKLQKMWKVANNKECEHFYSILRFYPKIENINNELVILDFSIEMVSIKLSGSDDIFDIADYLVKKNAPINKIDNFELIDNKLSFEEKSIIYKGVLNNQILSLTYYFSNEYFNRKYRFVPCKNSML